MLAREVHPRAERVITSPEKKLRRPHSNPQRATLTLAAYPLLVAGAPNGRTLHLGVERHDAVTESIAIVELTP